MGGSRANVMPSNFPWETARKMADEASKLWFLVISYSWLLKFWKYLIDLFKMVIFDSYVSLPEGMDSTTTEMLRNLNLTPLNHWGNHLLGGWLNSIIDILGMYKEASIKKPSYVYIHVPSYVYQLIDISRYLDHGCVLRVIFGSWGTALDTQNAGQWTPKLWSVPHALDANEMCLRQYCDLYILYL